MFLILNQTFYPDLPATAQHATDLALKLAASGERVTVIAGRRPYGGFEATFPSEETWRGIRIRRVGAADLGKSSRLRRAVSFASFLAACAWRLARTPRHDVVIAMTSPPLITVLGAAFTAIRGGRLVAWIMDLNPDEAVAAGWLKPDSLATRLLGALMNWSLGRASTVIVLDRFMKEKVRRRLPAQSVASIVIIPPGARDRSAGYREPDREAFRAQHGLERKFVVMYSGNHSPCHPLDTLLNAAERLRGDARFTFVFIGGGSEYSKVVQFAGARCLTNILTLPYQPEDRLAASLSAADLHAVVMGDSFVGIVHPSKVYNVLALGIPLLYIGPEQSHVRDIGRGHCWFHEARHGQADRVVAHIQEALVRRAVRTDSELAQARRFSQGGVLERLCAAVRSREIHTPAVNTCTHSLS